MIDAVRGVQDWLPEQVAAKELVREQLETLFHRAGYETIEPPILEHRELYLKKLGEELVGKLYDFTFHGRALALRPELTASVLRAYIRHLRGMPQPVRLRYAGPVFRYERPRRDTYRQFTQVGIELLGGAGPYADAEALALSIAGLRAVGIEQFRVTIGHVGLARGLLGALNLAERTQSLLIWSMERLRTKGPEAVRAQLRAIHGDAGADLSAFAHLADRDIEALLLSVLPALGVGLDGSGRAPEEIVGRLVRKLRRSDPQPHVERALALLQELAAARGDPAAALDAAEALLRREGLHVTAPLDDMRILLDLLAAVDLPAGSLILDFGMGRGLHYYTGLIFEIDDVRGAQLCGGGRYDDLVAALGGPPTPAVGFAYGLERVVAAAGSPAHGMAEPRVLVVRDGAEASYSLAMRLADALRREGWVALLDVRGRALSSNLRDAARRSIRYVAIVAAHEIRWRDLESGEERRLPADEEGLALLVRRAAERKEARR